MLKKLFKKKPKEPQAPSIQDLNGNPILEGDIVKSLRYELGDCTVVLDGLHFYYESIESKERVSFTKMVDAITGFQKVEKLDNSQS